MNLRKSIFGIAAVAVLVPTSVYAAPKSGVVQPCSASAAWQSSNWRAGIIADGKKHGFGDYGTYIIVTDDLYKALDKQKINYQTVTTGAYLDDVAAAFVIAAKEHAAQLRSIDRSVVLDIEGNNLPNPNCDVFDPHADSCPGVIFKPVDLGGSHKLSANPTVIANLESGDNTAYSADFNVTISFLPTVGYSGGTGFSLIEAHGKFDSETPFSAFASGMQASYERIAEMLKGMTGGIQPEPSVPAKVAACLANRQPSGQH